ncbi:MAG: response regulator [Myxococcales bacterium]|nr:response regulator [Myxococcales bacterium]
MALTTVEGVCVRVNEPFAEMLGRTPESLVGTNLATLAPADETIARQRAFGRVATGEARCCRLEQRFVDPAGRIVPVELRITGVREGDEPPDLMIVWATNLSEQLHAARSRRDLEGQVRQAERLKSLGVLVGGVAHDFNNLLTGILANAELLLEDLNSDSEQHICATDIREAARLAATLTEQLLAYGGRSRLVMEQVELRAVVQSMGRLLRASTPPGVDIEVRSAAAEPEVRVDVQQTQQMVMNLVLNAMTAVADGGHIVVSTGVAELTSDELAICLPESLPPRSYAFIEVKDDGCGMDAATRAHIFEPFFTTDRGRQRGMGLSVLLGIVRSHGGGVLVDSVPGRGSTFRVLVPCEPPTRPVDGGAGPLVLIVDDEPMVLRTMRRMVSRLGWQVETVATGALALQRLSQAPCPTLLLCDVVMPGMSGLDVAVQSARIAPSVAVVLMSGHTEHDLFDQVTVPANVRGFLRKPVRSTQVDTMLKSAMRSQMAARGIRSSR